MIARIKIMLQRAIAGLVSVVRTLLTIATMFSFAVLFVLFFIFMYQGEALMCLVCLAGIYAFIHLNKAL